MTGIESKLREIRRALAELNLKMDELLEERELTKLSEESLHGFLSEEPELYSEEDIKALPG